MAFLGRVTDVDFPRQTKQQGWDDLLLQNNDVTASDCILLFLFSKKKSKTGHSNKWMRQCQTLRLIDATHGDQCLLEHQSKARLSIWAAGSIGKNKALLSVDDDDPSIGAWRLKLRLSFSASMWISHLIIYHWVWQGQRPHRCWSNSVALRGTKDPLKDIHHSRQEPSDNSLLRRSYVITGTKAHHGSSSYDMKQPNFFLCPVNVMSLLTSSSKPPKRGRQQIAIICHELISSATVFSSFLEKILHYVTAFISQHSSGHPQVGMKRVGSRGRDDIDPTASRT